MIELIFYQDESGGAPFAKWFAKLRDTRARSQIAKRLSYMQLGNFGDTSPVGEGVSELRVHVGAGYRVYYARHGNALVLLLCGGDKSSQARDIKMAQQLWALWKKGQQR
ncbi:type II toxin-antitoxin system RelE/ParE family toxin [Comamonadaceae bacterium OH2545_COT-014]|nr:type II toxin-antitoxin system RelE/ParE family toxin [Comamonadaceae bacterium OH2545_COT-014]